VRAGIPAAQWMDGIVGNGPYRMSPVPREPLTTWKLRYKEPPVCGTYTPSSSSLRRALPAYAHSYSLRLYSPVHSIVSRPQNYYPSHYRPPYIMLLVVKALLTLVAAVGAWYALTPPQPPPRSQERVKSGGVERSFGSVVRIHALIWKACYTAPCALHTIY
jgi:hypothetical protein